MQCIGDLLHAFRLYALCHSCGKMNALDLPKLAQRFGEDLAIAEVRTMIRCADCGRRTGDVRIVYVGEGGKAASFHYR